MRLKNVEMRRIIVVVAVVVCAAEGRVSHEAKKLCRPGQTRTGSGPGEPGLSGWAGSLNITLPVCTTTTPRALSYPCLPLIRHSLTVVDVALR